VQLDIPYLRYIRSALGSLHGMNAFPLIVYTRVIPLLCMISFKFSIYLMEPNKLTCSVKLGLMLKRGVLFVHASVYFIEPNVSTSFAYYR